MTTPLFQIGGLASGLDTTGIVDQLMSIERNPVVLMNQQRARASQKVDAWSSVTTRVSAVRSSVDKLRDLSDFDGFRKASTSNDDVATVTTSGSGGGLGRLSFIVEQLAESHQVASNSSFSSPAASVGTGTFTITSGGNTEDFTADTLENLVADINSSDVGVSASAVEVESGDYRLILTSNETGEDNQFTVSGDKAQLSSFTTLQDGQDSIVRMGDELTGLRLQRGTNTVTDLVPGATINLRQTSTEPVTIDTTRDADATVAEVQSFVDSINTFMAEVDRLTEFDAEGDNDGPLLGDATLRDIENRLISEITSPIERLTGATTYAGALGIEFQTEGNFTLDEAKLREALENDYDAVASFFARSGKMDDSESRAQFNFATDDTQAGSYNITVTQAATQASRLGSAYSVPGSDVNMSLVNGDTTVDITIAAGTTIEGAITTINESLSNAGLNFLQAADESGAIAITSLRYGSGGSFNVTDSGGLGLDGSATGVDVAGTIDGKTATGSGRTLSSEPTDAEIEAMAEGDPSSVGLGVTITVTPTELSDAGGTIDLGAMSYSRGLMGELSDLLSSFEGADGSLASASERWENQIDTIDDQITRFEDRLAIRETTLRRQFTAMEQAMSNLQGQSSFLFAGLGSTG